MKIYFLIITLFLSSITFGQRFLSIQEDTRLKKYKLPLSSKGLFEFTYYNQIVELFPKDLMKKYQYTTAHIYEENNADVPSAHIGYLPNLHFEFDKNGDLIRSRENYKLFTYENEQITLEQMMYFESYENDKNNKLIFDKADDIIYKYNNNLIYQVYDSLKERLFQDSFLTRKTYDITYLDDKSRLLKHEYYTLKNGDTLKSLRETIKYHEDEYYATLEREQKGNKTDTIFFDKAWRPIKHTQFWRFVPSINQNVTYNEKNQIVKYYKETFKPYREERPNDRGLIEKRKLTYQGEIIDFEFRRIYDDVVFHYNKKGLLEKIIQTTDESVYEYRVYYSLE